MGIVPGFHVNSLSYIFQFVKGYFFQRRPLRGSTKIKKKQILFPQKSSGLLASFTVLLGIQWV
jgi:hypothetical protein